MLVLNLGVKERVDLLTFASDGRALAAAGPFGVWIWREISDGARAQRVSTHRWLQSVRFSEEGKSLFFCSSTLWRVNVATNTAVSFEQYGSYPRFDVSPDGRFILIARNRATPSTNVLTCRPAHNIPDAEPAGSSAHGSGEILWERTFPGTCSHYPHYLADGTRIVRLEGRWVAERTRSEFHIVTYDAATGEPVAKSPLILNSVFRTIAAPDGPWLVGLRDIWVYYWPTEANVGSAGYLKNDNRKHFTDAAFHPSGKYLAVTSNDTTVKLYDTTTWEVARTFTWKIGKMRSIVFSPDGTLAAAGSDRGQVIVWDVDL